MSLERKVKYIRKLHDLSTLFTFFHRRAPHQCAARSGKPRFGISGLLFPENEPAGQSRGKSPFLFEIRPDGLLILKLIDVLFRDNGHTGIHFGFLQHLAAHQIHGGFDGRLTHNIRILSHESQEGTFFNQRAIGG